MPKANLFAGNNWELAVNLQTSVVTSLNTYLTRMAKIEVWCVHIKTAQKKK